MSVRQEYYARTRCTNLSPAAPSRPVEVLVDDGNLAWSRWPVQQIAAHLAANNSYLFELGSPDVFNASNTRSGWPQYPRMLDVLRMTMVTQRDQTRLGGSVGFGHACNCAGIGLSPLISIVSSPGVVADWLIPLAARFQDFTSEAVLLIPGPIKTGVLGPGDYFDLELFGAEGAFIGAWDPGFGPIQSVAIEHLNRSDEDPGLSTPQTITLGTLAGGGRKLYTEIYAGSMTLPAPPGGSKVIQVDANITVTSSALIGGGGVIAKIGAGVVFGAAAPACVKAGQIDNIVSGSPASSATKSLSFKTTFNQNDYAAFRVTTPAHIVFGANMEGSTGGGSATLNSISLSWVNP